MSENLNEQTHIDTTGLKDVSEGFSDLTTANNQRFWSYRKALHY